jgi:hypothetical protein
MFGEHSGHLRMVVSYWDMAAALVNDGAIGWTFLPVPMASISASSPKSSRCLAKSVVPMHPNLRSISKS